MRQIIYLTNTQRNTKNRFNLFYFSSTYFNQFNTNQTNPGTRAYTKLANSRGSKSLKPVSTCFRIATSSTRMLQRPRFIRSAPPGPRGTAPLRPKLRPSAPPSTRLVRVFQALNPMATSQKGRQGFRKHRLVYRAASLLGVACIYGPSKNRKPNYLKIWFIGISKLNLY